MKKGLFTIFHYIMPEQGTLSLHASATEGPEGDTSILFGLSGTGKTTLCHDPKRRLIGDDETMWMPTGISNIEGGSYAKCIGLNAIDEPLIYNAIKFGAIVENARFTDKHKREINFSDTSITQNTRVSYPLEYVPTAKLPAVGGHPNNLIFLTCDANGLLPPVSKLTYDQAVYHFLSGYTATVGGVLSGNETTSATFSACFGEIFLPRHPIVYANLLQSKILKHKPHIYLVNTGWINGRSGVGQVVPAHAAHPHEVHAGDRRRHPQRRAGERRASRLPGVQLQNTEERHRRASRAAESGAISQG
jgi:phosphoenolpyruvate carboxykinase (ATP)